MSGILFNRCVCGQNEFCWAFYQLSKVILAVDQGTSYICGAVFEGRTTDDILHHSFRDGPLINDAGVYEAEQLNRQSR